MKYRALENNQLYGTFHSGGGDAEGLVKRHVTVERTYLGGVVNYSSVTFET